MQLWQLDVTGSVFLIDGTELKLISGIDDHSRFCVIATVARRATARAVCRAFLAAMAIYGIPEEVLTDKLAERLAAGYGDDDLFVVGWRAELGPYTRAR